MPYRWFFERAMNPVQFGPGRTHGEGNLVPGSGRSLSSRRGDDPEWRRHRGLDRRGAGARGRIVRAMRPGRRFGPPPDSSAGRSRSRSNDSCAARRNGNRFQAGRSGADVRLRRKIRCRRSVRWLETEGKIDRIDRDATGRGIVFDYKSGSSSYKSRAELKREGKVQLPLYLRALEVLWGLDPAAGLYVPIFAAKHQPRGLYSETAEPDLSDLGRPERTKSKTCRRRSSKC